MRTWTRAERGQYCGGCDRWIAVGDPMLVLRLERQVPQESPVLEDALRPPSWSVEKVRCPMCVGEAPPALPPLMVRVGVQPAPLVRAGAVRLPFGAPTRLRELLTAREPGEDG